MNQMSRRDAEYFYGDSGRIPPGVVNDSLPDYLAPTPPTTRIGKVVEKPASIIRRMAVAIASLVTDRGVVEIRDLVRLGFTEEQITRHADDARAAAMLIAPTAMIQALEGRADG
jgi:hypothetical protein